MAVNWNAFLTDDGLTLPDEQWSDYPTTTTSTDLLSTMTKSTSGCKPGREFEDLTGYNPLFQNTTYDETLYNPNEYFVGDFEVLQPFGNILAGEETATDSSPEPTSGVSLTGPFALTDSTSNTPASTSTGLDQSPQMPDTRQRPNVQRAQTYPNPDYESMFPNNMESGFVQDLTFSNGPTEAAQSIKATLDNEKRIHEEEMTAKRSKNSATDILSACWTSPLCPNHDQDGPPPNPSSCGGGCAPFLFAPNDSLQTTNVNNLMPEPQEVIAQDGIVEIQPRPKKRSESTSSSEPTGRQFRNPNAAPPSEKQQPQLKDERSEEPAQEAQATAEEGKPKTRRRQPHNQVERKYRESLNTQLESLRRVVPSLQQNQRACDGADIEDLPTPSKPSKAVILASATAYIKQIEKENKAVQEENQNLKARIKALQALVKCEDCSLMQYVMDLKINPGHQHQPKCVQ